MPACSAHSIAATERWARAAKCRKAHTLFSWGICAQSVGGTQVVAPHPGPSTARALILNEVPGMLGYMPIGSKKAINIQLSDTAHIVLY